MGIEEAKTLAISMTGLSRDALHIYVGLFIFVGMTVVFRTSMRSIVPWIAVLGVALVGELVDVRDDLAKLGHWSWRAGVHDFVNTIFWPTVLLFVAQRRLGE